jgi:hypothetical protein
MSGGSGPPVRTPYLSLAGRPLSTYNLKPIIPESRDASFRFCVRIHSLDILGAECLENFPTQNPRTSVQSDSLRKDSQGLPSRVASDYQRSRNAPTEAQAPCAIRLRLSEGWLPRDRCKLAVQWMVPLEAILFRSSFIETHGGLVDAPITA